MDLDSTIEKTISQIQKLMNANSIAGNPIPAGDRIIIPISKTALGFGVGVASNAKKDEDSDLGGAGGGGSIDPIALLVVYNDVPGPEGVEILPLDNMGTPLEDLLLGAGKALTGFLGNKSGKSDEGKSSETNINKIKTKIKPKSTESTKSTQKKDTN